ncbi:glycosyltransferase family 4 protein [Halomonas sp. BN3-1]|uniref:glycosyltransferase family 4 protein n=1 Tax=Halomonas sp. BN3-1 TaxID=2082393 RepID=UPI0013B41D08|nr:glycosyltransferase family 4 protein [Halomonas sp. BN3-1]
MNKFYYISNSVIPSKTANSVHAMKMCAALARNGVRVELLGKKMRRTAYGGEDILLRYGVKDKFKLNLYSLYGKSFLSPIINFIFFPFFIFFKAKDALIYSRNVHCSFVLSFILRVPHVYESHGVSSKLINSWVEKRVLRSSSITKVVAISEVLKQDLLVRYKVAKEKVVVVHDAADEVDDLPSIPEFKLCGEYDFNVGYAGSLLQGKGVELLCEAALRLPRYAFHIAGGDGDTLNKLKKRYKNASNLFFYGHLSQPDVMGFLNEIDVAVLPNMAKVLTADGEDIGKYTSPLKLFEYMSFRKKIVISDIAVFREIVSPAQVYFFKNSDVASLAQTIDESVNVEKDIDSLFDLFVDKYTWSKRARRVIRICERCRKE